MSKSLRTAVAYSALIAVMVVTVNLLTSPGFLWCIFPLFGVIWWPMSLYFTERKRPFAFAVCGAALISALLTILYLIASPGAHPWFLYPVLGVVWWPLGIYFKGKAKSLVFAVCGFAMIAALFIVLYLFASPGAHPWYLYPILGAFWWPLSVWGAKKGARAFSVAGGLYVILTVLVINLAASPAFWWWVYPAFFVLWWPVSVLLGEKAKTLAFSVGSAVAASLFLIVMYFIQTPNAEPWYLYALLPLFWWPISQALTPRLGNVRLSLVGVIVFAAYYMGLIALLHGVSSLLSVLLLVAAAWLVYATSVSKYRTSVSFVSVNAALLAGYFVIVHHYVTPGMHAWYWYTFFPLAWWIFAAALDKRAFRPAYVTLAAVAGLAYYGALNYWLSPAVPWILFLTGPAAVAVISSVLCPQKAYFRFSLWTSAAIIANVWAVDLLFTPHSLWAVYPTFAMLWWPLSMWLYNRNLKEQDDA